MNKELTYAKILRCFKLKGMRKSYNEGTETVRFTSKNPDNISAVNEYLLDCYPHYLANISYDVFDKDGNHWLELICISKEVA